MSEFYGEQRIDLGTYLQKRGIYLDAGDIHAAKTLLSHIASQQLGPTGKTFLLITLQEYLSTSLLPLDLFLQHKKLVLRPWQYVAANDFLTKQSDIGCTFADRMMIMDVLIGFINEHGNHFTV